MSRRTGSLTWIAAALSLFLVFVLPVCWSGAATRAWVERGQGPSSNNSNEEREEREHIEEGQAARVASRPPVETPRLEVAIVGLDAVHEVRVLVASVAPKPHPSRFSVRRLQ